MLHLEYKLDYFKQHDWEEDWIDKARVLIREHYDSHYATRTDLLPKQKAAKLSQVSGNSRRLPKQRSAFAMDRERPPAFDENHDELGDYLSAQLEATDDPITWWIQHHDRYPRLSRMALDYLAIPGTFFVCCQ